MEHSYQDINLESASKSNRKNSTPIIVHVLPEEKRTIKGYADSMSLSVSSYIRAVALGNIGDKRAVEPLTEALKDVDEYVRSSAKEALGKIRK